MSLAAAGQGGPATGGVPWGNNDYCLKPAPAGEALRCGLAAHSTCCAALKPQGVWKLRSAEGIFAALEDNSVSLSSMKASKYYLAFEKARGCAAQMLSWARQRHRLRKGPHSTGGRTNC